jgi:Sec-independent protein translocase protein TatA
VLALFGDIAMLEILIIAALSVMVFGRDLPKVAAQAFSKFQQARNALRQVWRDSGIGEEVRKMQRELEAGKRGLGSVNPKNVVRDAVRSVESEVRSPFEVSLDPLSNTEAGLAQGDASQADPQPSPPEPPGIVEPAGEAQRRPAWYPDSNDSCESASDQEEEQERAGEGEEN